jgi:type IV fimbrial biogenesis protein FimT
MNAMKNRASQRGFTLLELMVVVGIIAITAAIGVPSFKYVTTSNRASAEVNALLGDMRFARTEAVKQGIAVTVCASSDGATCAGTSTWSGGWIVFSDAAADHVVNGNDIILRVQPALSTTWGSSDTFASSPALKWVIFNREGFALTGLTSTSNIALHNSTNVSSYTRCVAVTTVGMVSTQKYGVGGCT